MKLKLESVFKTICLLFAIIYLFQNFSTVKDAILFLACLFLIYFLSIFLNGFFKKIIIERLGVFNVIKYYWGSIFSILLSFSIIFFLGSNELLSAISLAGLIYSGLFAVYYLLKRKTR